MIHSGLALGDVTLYCLDDTDSPFTSGLYFIDLYDSKATDVATTDYFQFCQIIMDFTPTETWTVVE